MFQLAQVNEKAKSYFELMAPEQQQLHRDILAALVKKGWFRRAFDSQTIALHQILASPDQGVGIRISDLVVGPGEYNPRHPLASLAFMSGAARVKKGEVYCLWNDTAAMAGRLQTLRLERQADGSLELQGQIFHCMS